MIRIKSVLFVLQSEYRIDGIVYQDEVDILSNRANRPFTYMEYLYPHD